MRERSHAFGLRRRKLESVYRKDMCVGSIFVRDSRIERCCPLSQEQRPDLYEVIQGTDGRTLGQRCAGHGNRLRLPQGHERQQHAQKEQATDPILESRNSDVYFEI
jgi:hypothetical protein